LLSEKEKTIMENPNPMGRRQRLEAFERELTGGRHIGHLAVYVQELEGWIFRRCRCGFSLALTPNSTIWWLKITKEAVAIDSFKSLLRALNSNCWAHPRPAPLKNAIVAAPAVAEVAAQTPEPPASESAISTASSRASLKTRSESKAKSKEMAPTPQVDKPPPTKQRRTYIPNNTTRTTRPRQNPPGR
jgi:hypothetical protein